MTNYQIKNEEISEHYLLLNDYITDCFQSDSLSISDCKRCADEKILEPYFAHYAGTSYSPVYHKLFIPVAFFYLLSKSSSIKMNVERLRRVAAILNKQINGSKLGIDGVLFYYNPNSLDKNDEFSQVIIHGQDIAKVYMKLVEGVNNYIDPIIIYKLDYYIPFIQELPINRLATFSRLYLSGMKDIVKFPRLTDLPELIKSEIPNQAALANYDHNVTIDFLKFMDFSNTPEWKEIQFNRKRTDISKVPVFTDFIARCQGKEQAYLGVMLYFMRLSDIVPYSFSDIYLPQIVLAIISDKKLDPQWMMEVFSNIHIWFTKFFGKLLSNIHDELDYNDPLVKLYEQYCFNRYNERNKSFSCADKTDILVLEPFYKKISDEQFRFICMQRIHGYIVKGRKISDNTTYLNIYDDDKLDKSIKLIEELNYITPIAVKSINTAYQSFDEEYTNRMKLMCDGEEIIVTEYRIDELNELLYRKNGGYQLVPIPIQEVIESYYIYSLGTLAICNYEQFKWVDSTYKLSTRYKSQLTHIKFSKTDAVPFEELKKSVPHPGTNNFETNKDWVWFKNSYIDKLSSKQKWYEVMNVVIKCSGAKTLNKKWFSELSALVAQFPAQQYYIELQALLSASMKEDFWFYDVYQKGLKGLIWSCSIEYSELSMGIVGSIIQKAYTKVSGVGPKCTVVGNFAINMLVDSDREEAFGLLNVMRHKTKYNRFVVALEKAIDKFKETSTWPEQLLADKTIPTMGFTGNERLFSIDNYTLRVCFENGVLQKEWRNEAGKILRTTPSFDDMALQAQLKELNSEVKLIGQFYNDIGSRIRTYWLYNRSWTAADWNKYILGHPLVNAHIQHMVWTNTTQGKDFIVSGTSLKTVAGEQLNMQPTDTIILWHPVLNTTDNIAQWQRFMWLNKITQKQRQVFREYYPFSEKELKMTDSPRFVGHFVEVKKLMAIANNQGWTFTYEHMGNNWPRIYIKQMDITFHLKADYSPYAEVIPTKEIFVTRGDTRKISWMDDKEMLDQKIPFREVPPVLLSELCRDVDLFIATTSVANNPDLLENDMYHAYRERFNKQFFSDNASVAIRKQILKEVLPLLKIQSDGFEGNYLLVSGSINSYKINLGSGFAQTAEGKHLNLLPSLGDLKKRTKKVALPIEDDDTLYMIIGKAMLLANDKDITDPALKEMLR